MGIFLIYALLLLLVMVQYAAFCLLGMATNHFFHAFCHYEEGQKVIAKSQFKRGVRIFGISILLFVGLSVFATGFVFPPSTMLEYSLLIATGVGIYNVIRGRVQYPRKWGKVSSVALVLLLIATVMVFR